MFDSLLDFIYQAISSPWVYLVLLLLAGLDGFFPVLPGETALVVVAVFAASGESDLFATIAAGAVGAFVGDHVSYLLGRVCLGRLRRRWRSRARLSAGFDWAETRLRSRGGSALIISRYVPGVRTATTMSMGAVRYPLARYSAFDSVAATCWAGSWSLIGYLGGATFEDEPLRGLLVGVGLALTMGVLADLVRRLWRRFTSRHAHGDEEPVDSHA